MNTSIPYQMRRFSLFLLGGLLFTFLTPKVDRTLGDFVILPLAGLYLATQWKAFRNVSLRNLCTIGLAGGYIAMVLGYRLLGPSDLSLTFFCAILKFYLCFVFILPLMGTLRSREVYYLLAVAIVSMFLSMAYNVHLKGVYGSLYSMRAFREESIQGIINTQYTTSIMLASGAFLVAVLHARTFRRRMLFLALMAACIYFNMTVGQRGIIFFLSCLLYGLIVVFNKPIDKSRFLRVFALAVLGLALLAKSDSILGWLAENVPSPRLQVRIEAVQDMLSHKNVEAYGGSFGRRMELVRTSWETFWASPQNFLLGVGDIRRNNILIGNHSHFADELARYGLFGGLLSFWLLFRLLRFVRSLAAPEPRSPLDRQLLCIFFVLLLRCFIGSVVEMTNGVQLFFTIPLLFRLIQHEDEWGRRVVA